MASHVYILRDLKHPRFKIGKANNILTRARCFRLESIDFQRSFGLRIASESDAFTLEKILQRTFRYASVDPLEVVATGGSADGVSEWFNTSCWPRLLQYLKENQDLHPHDTISGGELAAMLEKQLEPSQAVIAREQQKQEKEARRIKRELVHSAYRLTQLEGLRASLTVVQPKITQELERQKHNGNIVGVCDTDMGSHLVLADEVPLPSGALLWGVKPLSTHYEYPGGGGSIMSGYSQMTCSDGTISKVGLPRAYLYSDSLSEIDKIIYEVLQEEFEWLKQLQSIPDAWMRVIFASDSSSYLSSDNHEYEYAIGKVMDARLKSGYS